MFGKKNRNRFEGIVYDPQKQYPILHCSICTGETVAGFKDRESKHFTEVCLIAKPSDLEDFRRYYHIEEDIPKEY